MVLGTGITAFGVQRLLGQAGIQTFLLEGEDPLLRRSRWFRPLPTHVSPDRRRCLEGWLPDLPFERAVLVPCSDEWAVDVARLDPALRDRFPSSVTPAAQLELLIDKGRLGPELDRHGVPHPRSYSVRTIEDLEGIEESFFRSAFLKPRQSQAFFRHFGVKAFRVGSRAEAVEHFRRIEEVGLEVILQYYVPGPTTNHFFVDGFVDRDGVQRATFVRQRLRMYPPLFGNSTYMEAVERDRAAGAIQSLTRLLSALSYRGMFSAEFKLDENDGQFKLLEVNARAWWYVEFAARCGVDVVRMAYDDALERPVRSVGSYASGRRCVYPYNDYFAGQLMRANGELSTAAMLRSWLGASQPVFQWLDPWPALAGSVEVLMTKLKGRVARLRNGRGEAEARSGSAVAGDRRPVERGRP